MSGTLRSPLGSSSKVLVALVGNVASMEGFALIRAAEEMDGWRLGRCVVYDADVDALTLLDWAKAEGVDSIWLVFPPCEPGGRGDSIRLLGTYSPRPAGPADARELVRDIWMNLTGSLMREDYVRAMRALSRLPFSVYECVPRDGDCVSVLEEWLGEVCNDKDNRDR
ncbi:MAG: hypothetical protein F7C35_03680 [Desulfurococcales archaeon]|nr:hypothetical protein [Desulfurococcales archaeon]